MAVGLLLAPKALQLEFLTGQNAVLIGKDHNERARRAEKWPVENAEELKFERTKLQKAFKKCTSG